MSLSIPAGCVKGMRGWSAVVRQEMQRSLGSVPGVGAEPQSAVIIGESRND